MSEADVTHNENEEIEEQSAVANEPDLILVDDEPENERQSELIKFALLAVVLLGAALIIGLLRPYIFGKVIPAILGEAQPAATIINTEAEAETLKPEVEEENEAAAGEAETVEEAESDAEEANEDDAEASEDPVNPEDFPTAVPAQTHTVQPGETLTAIARHYGVTVQAIVEANQISNPDRVTAGTKLTIPEGQ
ncbi:LysM peptidoglycan-binding domain-containing protein [Candidatus Leptofilum sp.]|uniref:LysM peptidoglycan-binding domain-containing protein n=1 Tax=Candidatus Leptofilum sp. TaxID=3241576 RepID=UPI003B5A1F58